MATVTYPKSGKVGARPGKKAAGREERCGNPYWWRPGLGKSDEVRLKELYSNEYGQRPVEFEKVEKAIPVMPSRTIIHGR